MNKCEFCGDDLENHDRYQVAGVCYPKLIKLYAALQQKLDDSEVVARHRYAVIEDLQHKIANLQTAVNLLKHSREPHP